MDCQHIRAAIDTASRFEPISESTQRHLRACHGCRDYADGISNLLSLLQTSPRVTAPADFDFRLRARIAEAQAKRRNPFSFLEGFWSLSFSWRQTATAIATVALVATLAAFYFVRQTPTTAPINLIANAPTTPRAGGQQPTPLKAIESGPTVDRTLVASNTTNRGVKGAVKNANLKRSEQPAAVTSSDSGMMAGTLIMVGQSHALRPVTVSQYTYGAQPAVNRSENTLAMNQAIF